MFEFGSVILHKSSAKVKGVVMEPRWLKGLWLGKGFGTEEHIIATPEGSVVRSCAVKMHPEHQWDSHLFDSIRGTPWDPSGLQAGISAEASKEHVRDLPRVVVPREADQLGCAHCMFS